MSFDFKAFSNFKLMLTPIFIKIIFWVGVVLVGIFGLFTMVTLNFFFGFIILLVGPIPWRIYCELMILLFNIHESIEKIAEK